MRAVRGPASTVRSSAAAGDGASAAATIARRSARCTGGMVCPLPSLHAMPELPEVEITARRLNAALAGAEVESALAPGMVTMKTFDPPLDALAGRTITAVTRRGKMPVVEFGDLALLIHLMSAGRLQLFEKRASLRDKASRLLVRIAGGDRELRLREFGTQQRAWAKLLPAGAVDSD